MTAILRAVLNNVIGDFGELDRTTLFTLNKVLV